MPFKSKAARSRWYSKGDQPAKNADRRRFLRAAKRALLVAHKARPCMDCETKYPHYVMDFDHVRGIKSFKLATAADDNVSIERLLAEIAKCDVVCANCHRTRTYNRGPVRNGNQPPLQGE